MSNPWKGKTILITGVCGTIGQELLNILIKLEPKEIIGLDNDETELFLLSEKCYGKLYIQLYLCDLRDRYELMRKMRGVDIVLHAAALKHVILCERSPREAIQTNVIGTQNVIDAAISASVERVIFTSSDKAVNPTNVMGTSKLMGERLMTAANAHERDSRPIFASTRFGNVLGSRGSVIPIFKNQIAAGGPLTLTDSQMTRFIMTPKQAVQLVIESVFLAQGGEVFVTKMPVMRIADLADVMIEEMSPLYNYSPSNIRVNLIGAKPGEKLYEELMNDEETRRTVELERYFMILPAFKSTYKSINYNHDTLVSDCVDKPYNSANEHPMSKEELRDYLYKNNLLDSVKAKK